MTSGFRSTVVLAAFTLAACSHQAATSPHPVAAVAHSSCADRATQIVAQNVDAIENHRYGDASRATERAARVSLSCAKRGLSPAQQFSDRWRGANALVVAAELAHQAADDLRAHRLLHEGYRIMQELRPPHHVSPITSTLIAEKLDTARRDLHGEWAYW